MLAAAVALVPAGAVAEIGDGLIVERDLSFLTLSPYIELRGSYDSNVLLDEEGGALDDFFVTARLGLSKRKRVGIFTLDANAWAYVERYQTVKEADDEDFQVDFDLGTRLREERVFGDRDKLELRVYGDIDQSDAVIFETGDIEDYRRATIGASIGKTLGRLGDVDATYDYEITQLFSRDQSDWDENKLQLMLAPPVSDKSAITLIGEYGQQTSEAHDRDPTWKALRLGFISRRSDKTTLSASGGWIDHTSGAAEFNYAVAVNWKVSDKIDLQLEGNNAIVPSVRERNNVNITFHTSLALRYVMRPSMVLNVYAYHVRNRLHQEAADDGVRSKRENDTFGTRLRLHWAPPDRFYNFFLEGFAEWRSSDVAADDYDKYVGSLGVFIDY